jgi:hypothetical protein
MIHPRSGRWSATVSGLILTEALADKVRLLALNRPSNAMTAELREALHD